MAREPFNEVWAESPSGPGPNTFQRPENSRLATGWVGGAGGQAPLAGEENWWHNRVDAAMQQLERQGALEWLADVPYAPGAMVENGSSQWIALLASEGIEPGSAQDDDHWLLYQPPRNASETERGIVRLATTALAQGLVDDETALTPKKLDDAFKGSGQSLSNSGHQALPGGLIFQWTRTSSLSSDSRTEVSLPIAFPNAILGAQATGFHDGSFSNAKDNLADIEAITTTYVKVFMNAINSNTTAKAVLIFAIGY